MLGKQIKRRRLFSLPLIVGGILACKDISLAGTKDIEDGERVCGCCVCQVVDFKRNFIIKNGKAYHKHCLENMEENYRHAN